MTHMTHIEKVNFVKLLTAWAATVGTFFVAMPWQTLAQFAAFVYSILLILDWVRKRTRKSVPEKALDGAD